MNILILSWRSPRHPNAGGAEISTHEHAKAWVRAGHHVFWFSSYFKGAKKEETIDGVHIIREGRQFFGVQARAFLWYFFGVHPKFDLVVDQFHGLPFFTPLFVKAKKLAFIHEVAKEVWSLNPWPRPFNIVPAILGPLLEPLIFAFYQKESFMTVSESTRQDLVKWGIPRRNIVVIHNGVSIKKTLSEKFRKETKKTALFLGAISWDKGIKDAFTAFSQIDKKQRGWQFWVAGKASDLFLDWMKNRAKQLDIVSKFKYWGFVSDDKKFELFARAHVLVNPSVHEGWGLVNIEANHFGTPVVGYEVGGTRDSVKEGFTGYLCPSGDYRSLAQNAIKLVTDSRLYMNFSKNCMVWSKKFTWEKATKQSLRIIESL